MSVTSQTPYKKYIAAPGATLFSTAFRVLLAGDLQVKVNAAVVTTGFTLSGLGGSSTDVTFTAPMVGGETVELQRKTPLTRTTDYQQLGDFNAPVINADLDRVWMALQDANFLSALAVLLPTGDAGAPMTLPALASRINSFFAFDSSGNPIAVAGVPSLPTNAILAAFLASTTIPNARAALGALGAGLATASGLTQSTGRLLGRSTAGTGAIEEISLAGALTLIGGVLTNTSVAYTPPDAQEIWNTTNNFGSVNTPILRFTNQESTRGSASTDWTCADSAPNGFSCTINTGYYYTVEAVANYSGNGQLGLSLNSSQLTTSIVAINAADVLNVSPAAVAVSPRCRRYFPAGSVIRVHGDTNALANQSRGKFIITKG